MKKAKVIIGKRNSGKSSVARAIVSSLKEEEKVFLSQTQLNSVFGFSQCTEKTKVVIIDELSNNDYLINLIFAATDGIEVEKRGFKSFLIFPEIIVVCNDSVSKQLLLNMVSSIARRLEIIETIS